MSQISQFEASKSGAGVYWSMGVYYKFYGMSISSFVVSTLGFEDENLVLIAPLSCTFYTPSTNGHSEAKWKWDAGNIQISFKNSGN